MPVTSPYILTVSNTQIDLRKVSSWYEPSPQEYTPIVYVRMIDTPRTAIRVNKADFEAQMTLSLAAGG